ncbi:hypothetical protein N9L68_04725 [bacterium]|nr:hypothetical protein [bacterium]
MYIMCVLHQEKAFVDESAIAQPSKGQQVSCCIDCFQFVKTNLPGCTIKPIVDAKANDSQLKQFFNGAEEYGEVTADVDKSRMAMDHQMTTLSRSRSRRTITFQPSKSS